MDNQQSPTPPQPPIEPSVGMPPSSIAASSSLGRMALIGLAVLTAGLAIAYGGFYLGQKSKPSSATPTSAPTTVVIPTSTTTKAPSVPFQTFLSQNCKKITVSPGSFSYSLDIAQFPFKIPQAIVLQDPNYANQPKCWGTPGTDWVIFKTDKKDTLALYNVASVELGHGGYPQIGQIGTLFSDTPSLSFMFYRGVGMGSYIGTENITVRAIRKITWPDGNLVSIAIDKEAIPANDSRLLAILNKYAVSDPYSPGHMVVDSTKEQAALVEIKNTFFSSLNNLSQPEKGTITSMQDLLNGFSLK
ncbi:MAG TPA: hypothetical protein VLB73_03950 [Patescibacteria group bacterium]|nr:hypothetical protein [Patescibacteria group bacterium]